MKRKPTSLLAALLTAVLACASAMAQEANQTTPQQRRQTVVSVLRIINTAEVNHRVKFGRFATVSEFAPAELDSSRARYNNPAMPTINPLAGADAVPGFDLRIVVAGDGLAYSVKMKDKERGSCGTDGFSDEVGVIYLGGPIDCNFEAVQPFSSTHAEGTTIRISQGVATGNLTHKVDPEYPEAAKQARISGDAVYQIVIGTDGNVSNVRAASCHPMLCQAGMDAVRQWQFKPYLLNGQPIAVTTQVTIPFRFAIP